MHVWKEEKNLNRLDEIITPQVPSRIMNGNSQAIRYKSNYDVVTIVTKLPQ
jgi:hypothetical protein